MLDQILDYIHNYFEREVVTGTFVISGGSISVPFLQDGQYFKIEGSVFNDGIYKYPASDLKDETFNGSVWAMAVPPAVIALAGDIEAWLDKYGGTDGVLMSPYQSESFGGYSYSKSGGGAGDGTSLAGTWQGAFAHQLNRWRKI